MMKNSISSVNQNNKMTGFNLGLQRPDAGQPCTCPLPLPRKRSLVEIVSLQCNISLVALVFCVIYNNKTNILLKLPPLLFARRLGVAIVGIYDKRQGRCHGELM